MANEEEIFIEWTPGAWWLVLKSEGGYLPVKRIYGADINVYKATYTEVSYNGSIEERRLPKDAMK
jgi:hypothetical protein